MKYLVVIHKLWKEDFETFYSSNFEIEKSNLCTKFFLKSALGKGGGAAK